MKRFIKRAILKVGRPFWKRLSPKFYSRIDARIDMRLAQLDAGWTQHVPAFLNAVSSVKAFGIELAQSQQVLKDVRSELAQSQQALHEIRAELTQSQQALQEELGRTREGLHAALTVTNGGVQAAQERIEFVRWETIHALRSYTPKGDAVTD